MVFLIRIYFNLNYVSYNYSDYDMSTFYLFLEKCKQIFSNVEDAYDESIGIVRFMYITESMSSIVQTHMKKIFLKTGFNF